MMPDTDTITKTQRVAKSGHRTVRNGLRRIEVTVPDADAPLIRELAAVLRQGGTTAWTAKDSLNSALEQKPVPPSDIRTGADLLAFFDRSPLRGLDLDLDRDRELDTGRPVDLFGDM